MKVIHNTDLSAAGNDCYIYKSVTLFEDLGLYGVLTTEKTVGWYECENMDIKSPPTSDRNTAIAEYIRQGGSLEVCRMFV